MQRSSVVKLWIYDNHLYWGYRACKAQNIGKSLPYTSWGQPYSIYLAAFFIWVVVIILRYSVLIPRMWSVDNVLLSYVLYWLMLPSTFFGNFGEKKTSFNLVKQIWLLKLRKSRSTNIIVIHKMDVRKQVTGLKDYLVEYFSI